MSVSLEKALDLTWNWWGGIRIAWELLYLILMNVSSVWETGVRVWIRMSFHIRCKPGNQSISVVQLGSWRLLNYHVEFVRVTQERMLINGRIRPPYSMNRLFFLCLPFFYFLFMTLYTSSLCVYYILHTFSESPIYMHLYIHYLYVYIYIYIYTFFLSLKMLFLQREKLLPAFGPRVKKEILKTVFTWGSMWWWQQN